MIKYATVKETAKIYSSIFTESAIRCLIHHSKENDFEKCLRRIGAKIIINLDEFNKWIEEHKNNGKNK